VNGGICMGFNIDWFLKKKKQIFEKKIMEQEISWLQILKGLEPVIFK
jgi:hypothetical protein